MEWAPTQKRWVTDQLVQGCRNLYDGNLNNDVSKFYRELQKKGYAIREVGNGPRMHDGLIIRVAWLLNDGRGVFCLLKVDAAEWRRIQERITKELINPTVQPTA